MAEVVLITGCATGIGRALAVNLSERRLEDGRPQYKVWATDYRLEGVAELAEQGLGVAKLDVTDMQSIKATVAHVLETDGKIDMLICNAGLTAPGFLTEMEYTAVQRIFNVNLHGVFRVVQPVAKSMMARRSGKIAVLSSVNAYFVQPCNTPYSGTKAAVAIMAESLRIELAPFGISVVSVCPAWVKSDIIHNSSNDYERYERPESFFQAAIPVIKEARLRGVSGGCTTQQAANDIANGLSKQRPPRYLYTGTSLLRALFWGFCQQYLFPVIESMTDNFNLHQAAIDAPHEWKGHYVKQPPAQSTADAPTTQTGDQKLAGDAAHAVKSVDPPLALHAEE